MEFGTLIVGALLGAIGMAVFHFFKGFIEEFGKETAKKVKERYFPEPEPPPEPILVDGTYEKWVEPGTHAWVAEDKLYKMEGGGFTYHLEKTRGAKVYRRLPSGVKEFLMKRPDAA
jgi:hypothetical protein